MEHKRELAQDLVREEYRRLPGVLFLDDVRVSDRVCHGIVRAHQKRAAQA